jgi:predicted Rossmann fold nucleotide-binding protein DprA/Smf involved in DNA uptake
MLSPTHDAQAVLLLCANLGQRHDVAKPLTPKQYSGLAKWLHERSLRPRDLLQDGRSALADLDLPEVARDQIERLLDRGAALAVMVERWMSSGIWILSRGDEEYPARYKTYLQHRAPPLIYGVGDRSSLQSGGLAVVGSREASREDIAFAQRVGAACADQRIPLISGAAKGIDSESMMSAMNRKGTAIGVLADNLGRAAVAPDYRKAILDGYLTLISPYEPESRWFAFTAMERNKLIYALADAALVVAWSDQEGGTWAGAVEALKHKQIPVYVKGLRELPAGNRKMIQSGAQEFPLEPWIDLRQLFAKPSLPNTLPPVSDPDPGRSGPAEDHGQAPTDAYHYIIGIVLDLIAEPMDAESLTAKLNVSASQAKAWLKRGVEEGKIEKTKAPVRYVRKANALPLFANELRPPGLKLLEQPSTERS